MADICRIDQPAGFVKGKAQTDERVCVAAVAVWQKGFLHNSISSTEDESVMT